MGASKAAAIFVLAVGLAQTGARACDSYADEASLASVLARAVAEARANGGLEAQASHGLPAAAGPERAPEAGPPATSPAAGGEVRTGPRQPASSSL